MSIDVLLCRPRRDRDRQRQKQRQKQRQRQRQRQIQTRKQKLKLRQRQKHIQPIVENVFPSNFRIRFCFSNNVPFVKTVKWDVVQNVFHNRLYMRA